jgi:hypothetical protein
MMKRGNVCECQHGKLGVVEKVITYKDSGEKLCQGVAFDGTEWQSKSPKLIADNIKQYLDGNLCTKLK